MNQYTLNTWCMWIVYVDCGVVLLGLLRPNSVNFFPAVFCGTVTVELLSLWPTF